MGDEVADAYLDVVGGRHEWFGEAGCWTVIQPVGAEGIDVDGVVRLLGGDPADLVLRQPGQDWEDEDAGNDQLFFLIQAGPAVSMIEANGFQGSRNIVLSRLSAQATVHSACWNVLGKRYLAYAARGEVVTHLHSHFPDEPTGSDPTALDEDLRDLRALGELLLASDFEEIEDESGNIVDGDDWLAEMLAVIERRTGVRLDPEQLDGRHPSIILTPIPDAAGR